MGMGVETPRAFASFASLCGGRGERGGGQVGVWTGEGCDEERPELFVSGITVVELTRVGYSQ